MSQKPTNFQITLPELRAAFCGANAITFRAYTPCPILPGDCIQDEPLCELLLRYADGTFRAFRMIVRPGQLSIYRDVLNVEEIRISRNDEVWTPMGSDRHQISPVFEKRDQPGTFFFGISSRIGYAKDELRLVYSCDSTQPGWARVEFLKDVAGRTFCRYFFGKNLSMDIPSGRKSLADPIGCDACSYPRSPALYYAEYVRKLKCGAVDSGWGFYCETHMEARQAWALEDSARRAVRWLPVERTPIRKRHYDAHLMSVPDWWLANSLGNTTLFQFNLRDVFRYRTEWFTTPPDMLGDFILSALRNQDVTVENVQQILEEERLPALAVSQINQMLCGVPATEFPYPYK